MSSRILLILIVLIAAMLLVSTSTFVVREQELALRVQLSRIMRSDYAPGLHFKLPFVEDVVKFDRRVLTRKFDGEQFLTKDSQSLTVDYYIKWKISNASQFYQSTAGDETQAAKLIGENVQDGIKNAVAKRTLRDIVISDRNEMAGDVLPASSAVLGGYGIALIDVRLQRIDLQEDVASRVFESMKQRFAGIALAQRGEGERESQKIRSDAERRATIIVADAQAEAQRTRGEGDSDAAAIYARAYSRNPEFYSFWRSLQAYQNSLGKSSDVLVISPDSEFFKYLKSPTPNR
jgi:modulator of FtsH protease HflC